MIFQVNRFHLLTLQQKEDITAKKPLHLLNHWLLAPKKLS